MKSIGIPNICRYVAPITTPPFGMPGADILINTEDTIINRYLLNVISMPNNLEQNIPSNENDTAPPHIWIVHPKGTTTSVISLGTLNCSLQVLMVYGKVALDEHVVMVISQIFLTLLINCNGVILHIKDTGNIITINNVAIAHIYAVRMYFTPTPNNMEPYLAMVLLIKEKTAKGVRYMKYSSIMNKNSLIFLMKSIILFPLFIFVHIYPKIKDISITENRYDPVKNLFISLGIRFNKIPVILILVVEPFHSILSKIKLFDGLSIKTIIEDNMNVARNIIMNIIIVFNTNLLFNLLESYIDTTILVNTTGTIIYFKKLI